LTGFLKKEALRKTKKVLDIGSGSGIQAETCIKSGIDKRNLTLVDINKQAISNLKLKFPYSSVMYSNLFSNVRDKFDLIIFNPPYLPKNKFDNHADTTGGKKGDEVILSFLRELKSHLDENGTALLLLSSLTPMADIKKEFKKYKTTLLAEKKLFYETLHVWEIKLR
jgi:release factor glutamine methyltransferase